MKTLLGKTVILQIWVSAALLAGLDQGKYSGAFLMNPAGARAAGMGGAFTAVVNDANAVYWNPAGLVHGSGPQITGMHSERFAGMVNYDFVAVSLPAGERRALGAGYFRLGVDDIPFTRLTDMSQPLSPYNRPYVERYLKDEESAFFVSYSKAVNPTLSWGLNVKILRKIMGDHSAWGIGFDGGILYYPDRRLKLGAMLMDGTTTLLAWQGGSKEVIRPQLRIGAGYALAYKRLNILPSIDFIQFFQKEPDAQLDLGRIGLYNHSGIEFEYFDRVAMRIGSFRGQLTVGTGFKIAFTHVDYCFARHTDLGESHLISITLQKPESKHQ
jgi:hypothetical protein